MKYFAARNNIAMVVLREQKNLMDFMDFGTPVYCPGCSESVWGWVETERPITPGLPALLGLIPA